MSFLTNPLRLGIVWKDGKIKNHRSLLKVAVNPYLAWVTGYVLGTWCSEDETTLRGVSIVKCSRRRSLVSLLWQHWAYPTLDYDRVEFRRWLV